MQSYKNPTDLKRIMNLSNHITAFAKLGNFLKKYSTNSDPKNNKIFTEELNRNTAEAFNVQINQATNANNWFTTENIKYALSVWGDLLTENNLKKWTANYSFATDRTKTVAVIMAGNIPLVGFHDFLSVLMAGHQIEIKQSSNDQHLLPLISQYLISTNPQFKNLIEFKKDKTINNYDAAIATGSNNTARYFEHYFKRKPHIIRKNRNGVAVLTGNETETELKQLGEDIFRYFGLGCRSVSKLYVPKNYNFDPFFNAIYAYKDIINYPKYQNNYDYNKAVYLMSEFKLLENGFLMLKEDSNFASPIATLFYEYYTDLDQLEIQLNTQKEHIQCVVGNIKNGIDFGTTQQPSLTDYADGVDTMAFLTKI